MRSDFDLTLASFPGFGALLGLLWAPPEGLKLASALPAVVVYALGCGVLTFAAEHAGPTSMRARKALVAVVGVPWAVMVAALF